MVIYLKTRGNLDKSLTYWWCLTSRLWTKTQSKKSNIMTEGYPMSTNPKTELSSHNRHDRLQIIAKFQALNHNNKIASNLRPKYHPIDEIKNIPHFTQDVMI